MTKTCTKTAFGNEWFNQLQLQKKQQPIKACCVINKHLSDESGTKTTFQGVTTVYPWPAYVLVSLALSLANKGVAVKKQTVVCMALVHAD